MIGVQARGFVEELLKLASRPIYADPVDHDEEVAKAKLRGQVGGGFLGATLGGATLGSIGALAGDAIARGRGVGGAVGGALGAVAGTVGGGYLGGHVFGRRAENDAKATPYDVFQARADLARAEELYGSGEVGDKERLRATLISANRRMRAHGRGGLESDYLTRTRPGEAQLSEYELSQGFGGDPRSDARITQRWRVNPYEVG